LETKTCYRCRQKLGTEEFVKKNGKYLSWCIECNKEYKRLWARKKYWQNPEKARERANQWYWENHEKAREINMRYHWKNKDKKYAHRRKYYEQNKEKEMARMLKYKKENPEANRERAARYRALKTKNMASVVDYNYILERDGLACHICGKPVSEEVLHFDHVVPLSKGGEHSNKNIKVSHSFCNISKKDNLF